MGFAPQWLALREPADLAARDAGLLGQAARLAGPSPVVVDLGAGTGASLRALSPHMPENAQWQLVDHDPALLAHAVAAHPQARPNVRDLTNLRDLPLSGATLVSASALLDLVSENWLRDLAHVLAHHDLPFYAALSYDGVMTWQPPLAADGAVTAAFNKDQCTDKGFGPALGPHAWSCARQVFAQAGYHVFCAPSPWVLGHDDAPLQGQLLDGIATAAARAGYTDAQAWHAARQVQVTQGQCMIGHQDILAVPKGRVAQLGAVGGV